jgi:hypothetical protein
MKRSDFDNEKWGNIKEEIRKVLIGVAKKKLLIAYSDLTKSIKSINLNVANKDHVQILASLLGELSCEEERLGKGMISAIVIHKTGDQEPGPGFYKCAIGLGKKFSDKTAFWVAECNRVYEAEQRA